MIEIALLMLGDRNIFEHDFFVEHVGLIGGFEDMLHIRTQDDIECIAADQQVRLDFFVISAVAAAIFVHGV